MQGLQMTCKMTICIHDVRGQSVWAILLFCILSLCLEHVALAFISWQGPNCCELLDRFTDLSCVLKAQLAHEWCVHLCLLHLKLLKPNERDPEYILSTPETQNGTLLFTCPLSQVHSTLKIESVQNQGMHFCVGILLPCGHCSMLPKM